MQRYSLCQNRPATLWLLVVALVLGASAPPAARAQLPGDGLDADYTSYSLDDLMEMSVVYGASKVMQKAKEAPASITIITREEIETFGYRTMAEVLGSLRGFYSTYDHNYDYIGVRGLGHPGDLSSRMLCLVDGIRINQATSGGINLNMGFPVDLDLVERIEVIRGPASSVYGTSAMLGIINVVTREGYRLDGIEVSGGVESYGGRSARLTGGYETLSGWDFIASASVGQIDGQDRYIQELDEREEYWNDYYGVWDDNGGWFRDGDTEAWHSFFGKATYEGLTLESMFAYRKKQNPMAPSTTVVNDNSAQTEDGQLNLSARYRTKIRGAVDMAAQVYFQQFEYDGTWPYSYDAFGNIFHPDDFVVIYREQTRSKRLTAALDFSHRLKSGHAIAVGAEYQKNLQMDLSAHDEHPYYEWHDFEFSPENYGIYALAELRPCPGLILNLGLRHDNYSSFDSSTNPRIAIVTESVGGNVFKALYGTAFQAPNGYALGGQEDAVDTGRSGLSLIPEKIETYEFIWELDLGPGWNSSVTVYEYQYKEMVAGDFQNDPEDDPWNWDNDHITSRGAELGLTANLPEGIKGRASYTYNECQDRWVNPLWSESRAPHRQGKLNLSLPVRGEGTRLGLEIQYNSPRRTITHLWTREHTLVNLTLVEENLVEGLQIKASVLNALNSPIDHPATWGEYQDLIWQDGRSYRLFLTYSR
jgi:outer membrane receptor for ferrienterochelin and colicins